MKRSNNLQLLRFAAAVLVMISHAYPLSGSSEGDLMVRLSRQTYFFGAFSVQILFLFSGFLCAVSLEGRKGEAFLPFLKRKFNRLVPSLFTVVFACMLLGVFFSELSSGAYFSSPLTYKYLLNSVFILVHDLPGVFVQNVYGSTVNGSLWTMPVEMVCCMAAYLLFSLNLLTKKRILWTTPVVLALSVAGHYVLPEAALYALRACIMFYIGILYAIFRDVIVFRPLTVALSGLLFIVFVLLRLPYVGVYGFLHYCLMGLCFSAPQCGDGPASLGDSAYCLYLWGWPVQQTVVHLFGNSGMNPQLNYLLSIPAAWLLAYGTHRFVEDKWLQKMTTAS